MAAADFYELVQNFYVGFYGRPADVDGLEYWAEKADSEGWTTVRDAFAESEEAQKFVFQDPETGEPYGNDDLVNNIYQNLFGRDADPEGLEFYTEKLDSGEMTLDTIVHNIIDGAQDLDATVMDNKVEVAQYVTDNLGDKEYTADDISDARELLAGRLTDVDAAEDDADAFIEDLPLPPSPGEDFVLTDGRDDVTGTADDDTFIADVGQNADGAVANALSTGDNIDGGAGTDKIVASMINDNEVDGANAAQPPRPTTESVEQVYVEALENVTLDAGRMNNVEQFWSDNSRGDMTFWDVRLGDQQSLTKDITFGMRDVDSGSSLTGLFDTNSLTNEGESTTNSQILIRLADVTTQTPEAPLANVQLDIGFSVGGEDFSLEVESTDGTYPGMRDAIRTELDEQGLEDLSVELTNPYNQVSVGGNTVTLPFTAQEIVLTDPDGEEFTDVSFDYDSIDPVPGEFLVAGNAEAIDPSERTTLIETNVVLDNAGRGSTAGDVFIGGMSNSDQPVEKLNLTVDEDSSVNNVSSIADGVPVAFEQIEVTSGDAQGDLSINSISDTETFDASEFEGEELSVTAGVLEDEALYTYTTPDSEDEVNVTYDTDAVDSQDSAITVTTAGGDDTVEINTAAVTPSEFANHIELGNLLVSTGAGEDTVNVGDNGSAATVEAGAGNDYVQVSDSTDANTAEWIFNANTTPVSGIVGRGNNEYNVFKGKLQVEFQGVKSDIVDIEYSDFVTSSADINAAITSAIEDDDQLSELLTVTDLKNEGLQIESNVHRALGLDDLNINFIAPTYEPNDSTNQDAPFGGDSAELFAAREAVNEQEMEDAWAEYYPDSEGIGQGSGTGIYAGVGDASDMYDAMFGAVDYTGTNMTDGDLAEVYNKQQTEGGANSTQSTVNVINGGTGDDVIVLSSQEAVGFDTVVLEGSFGYDTVMNFNTGTSGPGSVADQLDFTSYLDVEAADRGASVDADDRVDQRAEITFENGISGGVGNGTIDHNAVVMAGQGELYDEFAEDAEDLPTSFDGISASMVDRALQELGQSWVDDSDVAAGENMAGSTFVFRVAQDQQIETDADGNGVLGDAVAPQLEKVFSVDIGWDEDEGEYTFTASEQGTIEYGDMFSDLSDVTAESVTGTADAFASREAAIADIKGEEPPAPEGPELVSITPEDDAIDVDPTTDLTMAFDKDVEEGTGNIGIFDADGVVESIAVTSDQVTFDGDVVTIDPATDLSANSDYFVRVQDGAIVDLDGNAYSGITSPDTWNFTTADGGGGTVVDVTEGNTEADPYDASADDVDFNFSEGSYDYFIDGFGEGDVLDLPTLENASITNTDFNDGIVDVEWHADGQDIVVQLMGLSAEQDGSIASISDMNATFGAGTVV